MDLNQIALSIPEYSIDKFSDSEELALIITCEENVQKFSLPAKDILFNLDTNDWKNSITFSLVNGIEEIGQTTLKMNTLDSTKIDKWISLQKPLEKPRIIPMKSQTDNKFHLIGQIKAPKNSCVKCTKEDKFYNLIQKDIKNLQDTHQLILKIAKECDPENISIDITSQELGLSLQELRLGEGELTREQADYLRLLLLGLNEKLKVLQIFKVRLIDYHNQLKHELAAHELLFENIERAKINFDEIIVDQNNEFEKIKGINVSLRNQLGTVKEKLNLAEIQIAANNCEIEQLKAQLQVKSTLENNCLEMQKAINSLQNQLKDANHKRDELRKLYLESLKEHEASQKDMDHKFEELINKNKDLENNLFSAENQISSQNSLIDSLNTKINQIEQENNTIKFEAIRYKNIEAKASQMEEIAKKHQASCQNLHMKLFDITNQFQTETKYAKQDKENLLASNKSLQNAYSELEQELIKHQAEIEKLNKEKTDLQTQQAALEEHLCTQEDQNQIKDELERMYEIHEEINQQIYNDIDFITNKLVDESSNNLQNQRISNRLKSILEDRDGEIEVLREMVSELQTKPDVYVAVKDDPIDAAIADYVNTRKIDVPFVREDLGIYLFGSKRVFIKLENGKIIIRVGGGYMKIDEFVELYTPLELEKFETKNKEDANSQRNSILGKLASNIVNDKSGGKFEISPQKAAQILKDAFSSGNTKYSTCIALPRKMSPRHHTYQGKPNPTSPTRKSQMSFGDNTDRGEY